MAIIMQNPDNVPGAVSTGYQLQNELLYAGNTGFCNVQFSEDYTKILGGSIFELNGKLIKCTADESITIMASITNINNIYFYIYAKMNTASVSFYASTDAPVWNSGKCGFYNGNDRALVKVAKMWNERFKLVGFDTSTKNSCLILPFASDAKNLCWEMDEGTEFMKLSNGGWYHVTVAGAGGGAYLSGNTLRNNGGDGGYASKVFYIPEAIFVKATIGKAGKNGVNYGGGNDTAATAGGTTSFESPEFSISFIAYGGGGGTLLARGKDGSSNISPLYTAGGSKGSSVGGAGNAEPGKITLYKFT